MFLPYRIETVFKQWPVANWLIIAATFVCFLFQTGGGFGDDTIIAMVLFDWSPSGLLGHVLLHGGWIHLLGNLAFLWVFGNAVCGNTHNLVYPLLYAGFAVAAAATHLLLDGEPAIGASGAINGVVGMALAMYPLNRVSVFWFYIIRGGTLVLPLWGIALIWLAFDVWGAAANAGGVAYWAHLGGFGAGLVIGLAALWLRWVTLTEWDNRSLADILTGRSRES